MSDSTSPKGDYGSTVVSGMGTEGENTDVHRQCEEEGVVQTENPSTLEDSDEEIQTTGAIFKNILTLGIPLIGASLLAFSIQTMTNAFVGRRLGPELFARYTLGISVANLFGFSIGIGLNGALDTFVSQAYGRDKQATRDIGVSMQRAGVVSMICAVPLSLILLFGSPLFCVMFGDELGNGVMEFTRHAVPNLILGFFLSIMTKVLEAINLPELVVYSTSVGAFVCLFVNYFFTHSIASAVATLTVGLAVQVLVAALLVRFHPSVTFWRHCEWPASKEAVSLQGLRQFMRLGIPSLVAVCAEWWAFEMLDMISANISVQTVASISLMFTVGTNIFAISSSISTAIAVLMGNAMGARQPQLAKQYLRAGCSFCAYSTLSTLHCCICTGERLPACSPTMRVSSKPFAT